LLQLPFISFILVWNFLPHFYGCLITVDFFSTFFSISSRLPVLVTRIIMPCSTVSSVAISTRSSACFTVRYLPSNCEASEYSYIIISTHLACIRSLSILKTSIILYIIYLFFRYLVIVLTYYTKQT
jgi:hypothetical protein